MDRAELEEFAARRRGLARRGQLDTAAIESVSAFESAGVDVLLLKGPALAERLYGDDEVRSYSDIDLFVPPRDLSAARDALAAIGYTKADEPLGIDDVGGAEHGEVWARAGEDRGPVLIDLHWRLNRCGASGDAIWDALAAEPGSIRLRGKRIAVPGDPGLAFHVGLHAAQHGLADAKAMADLTRGLVYWPPEVWRSAARLARSLQAEAAFAAGLRLLPAGRELAAELELQATRDLDWEIRNREARPRGTFHLEALLSARGFGMRLSVLRRSLFPRTRWIQRQYPWAERHRALVPLAYACHILRAPLWAVRALRFRLRARRAGQPGD